MKKLLLFPLVLLVFFNSCESIPMKIKIDPNVSGNHEIIKNEIIEGVEFFCQERNIDCKRLQKQLVIKVKKDPFFCGNVYAVGCYNSLHRRITIQWLGGVGNNALLHELMHHEIDLFRTNVEHHSEEFYNIVNSVKNKWREQ